VLGLMYAFGAVWRVFRIVSLIVIDCDSYYLTHFYTHAHTHHRETVDRLGGCEELAMNLLITHKSGLAPLHIKSARCVCVCVRVCMFVCMKCI
jgi:hypothetical protein